MSQEEFNPETSIGDLSGRVYLITGGTTGLGAGTISLLAAHNPAKIFFSGRNASKAKELITEIKKTSTSTELIFLECDLSSLASVQHAARHFLAQIPRLDVLMCNAGIIAPPPSLSADGYEIQFATNHLGHALLTKMLLPTLLTTAAQPGADVRIITLSSTAHTTTPRGGIDFSTLKTPQASLGPPYLPRNFTRYGQSKLANMLYAAELARRHPSLLSVSVHPGFIKTHLTQGGGMFNRAVFTAARAWNGVSGGRSVKDEEGPWNQTWAATTQREGLRSGAYYEPMGREVLPGTGYGRDGGLARSLWEWTEEELKVWS